MMNSMPAPGQELAGMLLLQAEGHRRPFSANPRVCGAQAASQRRQSASINGCGTGRMHVVMKA